MHAAQSVYSKFQEGEEYKEIKSYVEDVHVDIFIIPSQITFLLSSIGTSSQFQSRINSEAVYLLRHSVGVLESGIDLF